MQRHFLIIFIINKFSEEKEKQFKLKRLLVFLSDNSNKWIHTDDALDVNNKSSLVATSRHMQLKLLVERDNTLYCFQLIRIRGQQITNSGGLSHEEGR